MRLILSRKGFDSSSGGCPSPILPDGRLCSLPIPDTQSPIPYGDLMISGVNAGELVADLTRKKMTTQHRAHLDPDLEAGTLPREAGWTGVLGQDAAAQSHLRNQGVTKGDLFVFFGLFRPVERQKGHWRFVKAEPPRHVIWGWLQVASVHPLPSLDADALPWARYHPHFYGERGAQNTLYQASCHLRLGGSKNLEQPGFGTFSHFAPELQLTAPGSPKPSQWQLPRAFYPTNAQPLTYHGKLDRWQLQEAHCLLSAAARGQEFVLDLDDYPGVMDWIRSLFRTS